MKKLASLIMAILIAIMPMNLSFANEDNAPLSVSSKSAILMDVGSGQILYEKNAHDKLPPASVTKVMTMLLICEALDSGKITLDDSVQISDNAASMGGSQIFLEAGEVQKVDTLLNHLTKLSEKVSKELAMYLKGVEGINIYNKYYDIFPNERHADGVSYSFLLDIYDKLGSDSFISYEDFLHTIYTYVTRNYYVNGSLVISPVGEFYKKIGKYDVFKNYDFNSLSDKDKVLFGLCENKSTLTEVVNTNILKRKI